MARAESSLVASNTRERIEREWMGPRCVSRNGASGTRTRSREGEGIWTSENIRLQVTVRTFSFTRLLLHFYTLARMQTDRHDRALRPRIGHLVHVRMHKSNFGETCWRRKNKNTKKKMDRTIRSGSLRDSAGSSLTASTHSLLHLCPASFAFIVKT